MGQILIILDVYNKDLKLIITIIILSYKKHSKHKHSTLEYNK
jgi:hypothetical protein